MVARACTCIQAGRITLCSLTGEANLHCTEYAPRHEKSTRVYMYAGWGTFVVTLCSLSEDANLHGTKYAPGHAINKLFNDLCVCAGR